MTQKNLFITGMAILFANVATATELPNADDTGSTQQGVREVVNANNEFALDLYSKLHKTEKGNIFYSPYSVSSALAMTYEGAKGQTAHEIKSVFHFPENNILRPNFAAIYNKFNKKNKPYTLNTGNALWVQQNFKLLEAYISTVENYYGGKATNLDFIEETEKSRQTINTFIEGQTANKIKNLIPSGSLSPSSKLVLTNAIYFKGTWVWTFDKTDTYKQDFEITPANSVKVSMMHMKSDAAKFNYADLGDLQVLELPYKGDEISMLVLLPKNNLDAIESSLTPEKLQAWKSQMRNEKLDAIYLPKFEFNTKYFMKEILSTMGMPTAFGNADFSGMTGTKNLFIDEVIHQAFVKVDEEGTQAAGATAVLMRESAVLQRKIFNADHPFLFVIQEKEMGNILFLGRVIDPTK